MKTTLSIIITFFLMGLISAIADEYRTFTDENGREIDAKIIRISSNGNEVTIQRKGQRKSDTVPISIFNKETQDYIRNWIQISAFLNERTFPVALQKKKAESDGPDGIGKKELISYYDYYMEMEIENKSEYTFEDVILEYALFYTQETLSVRNKEKRDFYKEPVDGILYNKQVVKFPTQSKHKMNTEKVMVYKHKATSELPSMDGELEGIIIRLTWQTASGENITKEIVYPEDLQCTWTTKTKKPPTML